MRLLDTRRDDLNALRRLFDSRLDSAAHEAEGTVRAILDDVRERGDAAVLDYTRRWGFERADALRVTEEQTAAAVARIQATPLWPVLNLAVVRIRAFHERQLRQTWVDASRPGEMLGQILRPLNRVGVYAPGGTADYPSTVLMAAIPAVVAGVGSVALASPPGRESGLPADATLTAAHLAGVREVYAMGGAEAVAAFAFGTESVPRVDKIVGPGSIYVNLAKRFVYGTVGIDMLAGPSEVAILADGAADPAAAAADILAQCEHDSNSSALVATDSEEFAAELGRAIEQGLSTLPRAAIVRKALAANGFLVQTRDVRESADVVSLYAPEHLHVDVEDPWAILPNITNAGAILIGKHASASLGDYLAGPSHTLPTAGCARFASPLNVDDFVKKTSLIYFDGPAAEALQGAAATFAEFEGLEAHVRAARRESRAHP
ncbi:MAG TPA: histidinol dehydrogenase [Armatimonadaceae bacterium]|nr:histidinol dehydrogenase [Armatimonadaceae bacterium]